MKIGFKTNLESHNIKHANSFLIIISNFPAIGIETRYINKILKEMATVYASLINQYTFKNLIIFSSSFYKINEEYQRSDEIEFFIILIINDKLTEKDFDKMDIKSQLEHQIQIQETKESGWNFDKIIQKEKRFYEPGKLNGSNFVEIPLRSSALINFENNDKYSFARSKLASLCPCDNDHPTRV